MWVRVVATVPSNADAVAKALVHLTPEALAGLAQAASRNGGHVQAHLALPVRRDEITTFHLRWWNDHDRSLTPSVDGELALRPRGPQSTEMALTAQYRCREALRELAGSIFLRRVAESVVGAFLDSLIEHLELQTATVAVPDSPVTRGPSGPTRLPRPALV